MTQNLPCSVSLTSGAILTSLQSILTLFSTRRDITETTRRSLRLSVALALNI